MKINTLQLSLGAVLIIGVGLFVYFGTQANRIPATQNSNISTLPQDGTSASVESVNPNGDASGNAQSTTGSTPATSGGITLADIAKHSDAQSCWSAINGNVYDLTSWIPQHPGGPQAILSICGIDGSGAFNAMHGGRPRQAMILAGFKIGTLAQ